MTYYHAADVFVFPTHYDTWGLVVSEAMHYGTPVIVSAAAGSAELVERYANGYVVNPDDIDALAARLTELLEDAEQRHQFAQRSKEADEVTDTETGTRPFRKVLSRILE